MAFSRSLNYAPANIDAAEFELKRILKLAGHTVPRSSDGTTYNSSGDQISAGTAGANGWANTQAWFCVRDGKGREWCIQRGSSTSTLRVKTSPAVGFTTGSPDATHVPSASDEIVRLGGGTDASPTFATVRPSTAGAMRYQILADGGTDQGWVIVGYGTGARPTYLLGIDPMAAGSYSASDTYPYVTLCNGNTSASMLDKATLSDAYSVLLTAYLKNGASYTSQQVTMESYYTNGLRVVPDGLSVNPVDGNDPTRPIVYSRAAASSAPNGEKGQSSLFKWGGVARAHCDLFTIVSTKDFARMGDLLVGNWDGATTPAT